MAFPLSGGRLVDTNAVYTSCQPADRVPDGVQVPPDFVPTGSALCTKSLLGWPTARLFVVSHRAPDTSVTTTLAYALDRDGRQTPTYDLGGLQAIALVLMRWGLDRRGWRSLGRRWLSLTLVPRQLDHDLDRRAAVDRRYVLFGLPVLPGLVAGGLLQVYPFVNGPVQADVLSVVTFVGNLPLTVALIAAVSVVARGRDAFYDAQARTAVARLVDGSVQVAPDRARSPLLAGLRWPGPAAGLHRALHAAPWGATGLAAFLCVVFLAERFAPTAGQVRGGVAGATLVLFGGADGELVRQVGQWYRLVAAIFVHASVAHLVSNAVVLLAAGWFLEGVLGRGWFFAAFLLGGFVASLASVTINPATTVSVGASGAITAVIAAGYVVSLRLVDDARRLWLRAFCLACLAAAVQATGKLAWGTVDHAAHVGGALGGAAVGGLVAALWGRGRDRPPLQKPALGAALVLSAAVFAPVPWTGFGDAPLTALLIPPADLPRTDAEWVARSGDLVRRYPADPRAHEARAVAAGDDAAEREREIALTLATQHRFTPDDGPKTARQVLKVVGSARQAARDWPAALDLFSRAVAASPVSDPDALGKRVDVEEERGSFDDAIADLHTLVGLRPQDATVKVGLAFALFMKGEPHEAAATLDGAGGTAADAAPLFRARGWIGFFDRREDAAVRDLERAASLDPKDAYAALWLDIAATRSGSADRMRGLVHDLDRTAWPWPVVRLFLGETDFDAVWAASADADPVKNQGQRCEADFYYGEWRLMRHDEDGARPHLRAAATSCPRTFSEWPSARAELAGAAGLRPDEPAAP